MANINNSRSSTIVAGTSSADSIYNSGDYSTINADDGNDTINNNGYYSKINAVQEMIQFIILPVTQLSTQGMVMILLEMVLLIEFQ